MAKIITPDGGFYLDDTEFNVDYSANIVTLVGGTSAPGGYLPLSGGTMGADAVIEGTDSLEISLTSGTASSAFGVTPEGASIINNQNSAISSSVRAIQDAVEITADNTSITINGTGVNFGGAALANVSSIGGNSAEVAFENDMDMNNHSIINLANPVNPGDAMNKSTADSTYATKDEISNFITNDELPTLATTSVAGIVKQGAAVSDSSGATDTSLETVVNNLLASLRAAGIIASA